MLDILSAIIASKVSGGSGSSGGGLPSVSAPHQMLVTDADGKTVWEERPYYRKTEKYYINDLVGDILFPCTITTANQDGVNLAQCEPVSIAWEFITDVCEVWFDGKKYICGVKELGENRYIGATVNEDNTVNFEEYPFAIMESVVLTESEGEHTLDIYTYSTKTNVNYGPTLFVDSIGFYDEKHISMEDVEKIKTAWKNGATVIIGSHFGRYYAPLTVTDVSSYAIYASGAVSYDKSTITGAQMFLCSDGSIADYSQFYGRTITENATDYTALYIGNKWYKVTVDGSGTLTATEVTD